jgi:hypothetical protein
MSPDSNDRRLNGVFHARKWHLFRPHLPIEENLNNGRPVFHSTVD